MEKLLFSEVIEENKFFPLIYVIFSPWYPWYKDEILSMNNNITLKNRKNKIAFLNKHIEIK